MSFIKSFVVKRFLLFIFLFPILFSGCEKDTSDERIYSVLVGKWIKTASNCDGGSWFDFKSDGTYDEFDGCATVMRENAGKWRIENQQLYIKAKVYPIDVPYSFYYLSTTEMIIVMGKIAPSKPQIKYRKD